MVAPTPQARPDTGRDRPRPSTRLSMGYVAGLDGMRAVAVIAVLLYHADVTWLPGGFLGVEVFFVISGYLITALLLAERGNTGRIHLREFWLRRARRLLPALFAVLAVTSTVSLLFVHDAASKLKGGVVAALLYATNWYATFSHQSYFEEAGRPSLLQHLWSLAVEEQFYLLWPLLLILLLKVTRGRRLRLGGLILAGSLASNVLMAVLFDPHHDPSRVYYGTDTRAGGLLLGAALAVFWAPWLVRGKVGANARWVIDGIAGAGLLVLAWSFIHVSEFSSFLYRGGFALAGVATCIVIAAVVHPSARITRRALSLRPMRWIGQRSYGIYLWHWPVFTLTRPQIDVSFGGVPLLTLRMTVTLVIAAASYRYLEQPVRNGAITRFLQTLRDEQDPHRASKVGKPSITGLATMTSAAAMVAVVALATGLAAARAPAPPPGFESSPVSASGADAVIGGDATPPATTDPGRRIGVALGLAPPPTTTIPPASPIRVTAVGDSVMLGAKAALVARIPGTSVDAKVGRDFAEATGILRSLAAQGILGDEVVIHLGSNGPLTDQEFDDLMAALPGVKRVVFLNVKVPRSWERVVNQRLASGVARYPNAVLIDWRDAVDGKGAFFYKDGIHLKPAGAAFYADLIAGSL